MSSLLKLVSLKCERLGCCCASHTLLTLAAPSNKPPTGYKTMGLTSGSHDIPYLPAEVHLVIARYLHRDDLPRYRLVSRVLADIGKPELFKTIVLQSTVASVSALKHILQNKQLSNLVRTLIWDINTYRIGTDVRDWHEWTGYCESRAEHVDSDQAALYMELAASRQHWESYLSRVDEERAVTREIQLLTRNKLRLPNLQATCIVKGAYQLDDRHVSRSQAQAMRLPVTRPLEKWRGDTLTHSVTSACLSISDPVISNTTKCRIFGFTLRKYSETNVASHEQEEKTRVTSLKIKLRASEHYRYPPRKFQVHAFSTYLVRRPNLESLRLDLHSRIDTTDSAQTAIQDIFEPTDTSVSPEHHTLATWPKLRKLSLNHFDSSPRALVSLVTRHSSTLRDLRLKAIWLDNREEEENPVHQTWVEVFRSIGTMTKLDKVVLSGAFRNTSHEDDVWDFDDEKLQSAVADWICDLGKDSFQDSHMIIREPLKARMALLE
ncbi:hypothetical protein C7974DRAFT_169278 [Boeremia exigua]|uniref:uncharacterized protein n=1 Tax=Boeremia exigua TaxID=749465 RepID=UPI001E8DD0F7|nr:uncharacterized protein C7974DRAFT_169278 [Boeremia exigua]KAH6633314.1 hypothetical protein C7974DRAFT_169278 [Boeremia exigua]